MRQAENLISIVVPVYNKAEYLPTCLESLQVQTYRQIEVVLVDDGSTDDSGEICRDFCAQDDRFRYLRQANGGQNAARLTGIESASGTWVMFVDADDFVIPEMCERMMERQRDTGVDLIVATMRTWTEGKLGSPKPLLSGVCTGRDVVRHFISNRFFQFCLPSGLCPVLYRKQSVENALKSIDSRITFGEDVGCSFAILLKTERIAFLPEPVYYYRQVAESVCHGHDKSNVLTQKWLLAYLRELFVQHDLLHEVGWIADWLVLHGLLLGGYEFFNDYAGLYPFFRGMRGGRVAIYGAGVLGEEIATKLTGFDIVGWYDRNWKHYRALGREVEALSQLADCNCDDIIIAIQDPVIATSVQHDLHVMLPASARIHIIAQDIIRSEYSFQKLHELSGLDETYTYSSRKFEWK